MEWSINCPHCGYKHENWQEYIDTGDMEGSFEMDCENESCERPFTCKFKTKITFETEK